MKVNQEKLIKDLISRGIDSGYIRSHINNDNPTATEIKKNILNEVMNEIKNYFIFESLRDVYPANVAGTEEFNKVNQIDKRGGYGC